MFLSWFEILAIRESLMGNTMRRKGHYLQKEIGSNWSYQEMALFSSNIKPHINLIKLGEGADIGWRGLAWGVVASVSILALTAGLSASTAPTCLQAKLAILLPIACTFWVTHWALIKVNAQILCLTHIIDSWLYSSHFKYE